ncbi:MAG: response regulator transcription factor [Planctomycetota bacterium]
MSKRVLVIEDDTPLRTALGDSLALEGYDVTAAATGHEGRELLLSRHFDLVLLDLAIPGPGGLELLRLLREKGIGTPVLILTAKVDESDRVLGLELEADDYITKPFSLRELLARVRAHLRREERGLRGQGGGPAAFRVGEAEIDLTAFELRPGRECHSLSPKEARMLALLYAEAGRVVSRNRFLDEVWGTDQFVGNRSIDTHVLNLRKKLEPDPAEPRVSITVHGVGYKLVLG